MNGDGYEVANAPTFSSDYTADYFEVYSPLIRSQYSEVFWRMQEPVSLPDEIQERFANKVMSIVGYEADQVRKTPEGDVPVPITWAYNHHYEAYLTSSAAVLVKKEGNAPGLHHGTNEYWTPAVTDDYSDDSNIPLSTLFSEANGGEFRKSYHGYPKGYAQLIESPNTFQITPMQIDTWNREMVGPKYIPGPLPKASHIPASAGYNGLLECPCSDRLKKEWEMMYKLETSGSCDAPVHNSSECLIAARQLVQAEKYVQRVVSDPTSPSGCSVEAHLDGSAAVVWNLGKPHSGVAKFVEGSPVVAFAHAQVSVTVELVPDHGATIAMVGPVDKWFGVGFGSESMCIHMQADECPDGGPYAIVVTGEKVVERKLDFHGPGTVLEPSFALQSNVVKNEARKVILTRPLNGATSKHFTFDPSVASVPIITARGCSLTFAQHCGHGPSKLTFLASDVRTGICQAGISGTIGGNIFNNKRCAPSPTSDLAKQDNPTCYVQTYRGGLSCCRDGQSLLDQGQENPWAGQYLEYYLKFRFYFQEYQPENSESRPSHHNLVRLYWQTESFAGEYDIVQCKDGVPPSQCIQMITSQWKVSDMLHDCSTRQNLWCTGKGSTNANVTEGVKLIYAGPHCHAPTCLSMELYNADAGQLLCKVEPTHGKGDHKKLYDEQGFIAIPPCLWGTDESEGLPPPQLLSLDTTLVSIKRNNNTLGHTGEMASWQMRGVVVPKKISSKEMVESTVSSFVSDEHRGKVKRMDHATF